MEFDPRLFFNKGYKAKQELQLKSGARKTQIQTIEYTFKTPSNRFFSSLAEG